MAGEPVSRILPFAMQTRKLVIPFTRKLSRMSALAMLVRFIARFLHVFPT